MNGPSFNEWTFLAPVGLIQSASLLGRECTGISLMELIHLPALAHLVFSLFPTAFGYGAPHPSARGTSTLLNNALLSAHYGPLRLPTGPPRRLCLPVTRWSPLL